MNEKIIKVCDICEKEIKGKGNDSQPIKKGICCDECNQKYVIPATIKLLNMNMDTNITNFLGYYRILDIPESKKHLPRYQQLKGEVCKVYKNFNIDDLICDVKGHYNDKSIYGYFYFTKSNKNTFLYNYGMLEPTSIYNIYTYGKLEPISKDEYQNHIPNMEKIYLIKGFHPNDFKKKSYYFKSSEKIKENTKVYVDSKLGKTELIVTDCITILKDQEKEYLEKFGLEEFKKVLSVIEEVEVIKKEVKEKKIKWK